MPQVQSCCRIKLYTRLDNRKKKEKMKKMKKVIKKSKKKKIKIKE